MKKVEHYVCEICGTEYSDKNVAMQCEKSHRNPLEIKGSRYVSYRQNEKGYPVTIEVKMTDGAVVTYKR